MKTIVLTTTMRATNKTGVSAFVMCDADLVQTIKNVIESNSDAARKSDTSYCIGGTLSAEQLANTDLTVIKKCSNQGDESATIELKKLLLANNTGRVSGSITKGHLANNGGIRGHSAGEIFPYRIMIQGTFDALVYWVISPQGAKIERLFTAKGAYDRAVVLKGIN